jgi:hypothetical protein
MNQDCSLINKTKQNKETNLKNFEKYFILNLKQALLENFTVLHLFKKESGN